jgi:hypothetical protein
LNASTSAGSAECVIAPALRMKGHFDAVRPTVRATGAATRLLIADDIKNPVVDEACVRERVIGWRERCCEGVLRREIGPRPR